MAWETVCLLVREPMLRYHLPDGSRVSCRVFLTPPDIVVLNDRELGPSHVLGCPHRPLCGGALAISSGDTAKML